MTNPPQPPPSDESPSFIDIPQAINQVQWAGTLSREDPIVKEYRLKNEKWDATHKRWRLTSLFAATLILCGVLVVYCLQVINNPNATADDKKWATATITLIVGAGVGFVTGKAIA